MSMTNGSVYQKKVSRSVYSDSNVSERINGYSTPRPPKTYLEVPRAPSRARSPKISSTTEVTAVDPTLEDAQKAGNNYHITMSLNAALADAGFPASVAMATGRNSQMDFSTNSRSQMEYATNSRNQMDYATNSRSVSRIGVHPNDLAVPIPAPRVSLDRGRNGRVSVIQVAGSDVIAPSPSPYPTTIQRDFVTVNEGYTIKSVRPSTVKKEVVTTVERVPGSNTVGFDLELIGGQKTTIKKTVESGSSSGIASLPKSKSTGKTQGSWETNYTKQTRYENEENEERGGKAGKRQRAIDRGKRTARSISTCSDSEEDEVDLVPIEMHHRHARERPDLEMIGIGTKRSSDRNERPNSGMLARGSRESHVSVTHSRGNLAGDGQRESYSSTEQGNPWLLHDDGSDPSWAIYHQLIKGAGPGTVQQRVTVERDEDDIIEDGPQIKDMLNVDTVSEKVLVFVGNDMAEMTIKVRTERIVPIQGSSNMFRKSAVTVNRIIEVDMMATPERQRIYDNVIQKQRMTGRDLSQKETFDLYKAFLRLAEADEGNAARDQIRIDKTTDEAQLADFNRSDGYYAAAQNSYDEEPGSDRNTGGYRTSTQNSSRYRESRFNTYGNEESEVSSALY